MIKITFLILLITFIYKPIKEYEDDDYYLDKSKSFRKKLAYLLLSTINLGVNIALRSLVIIFVALIYKAVLIILNA